jgi:hypothetical protein
MKRSLLLFASTAGLLCWAVAPARAGLIPAPTAQWSYNFTPSQSFVSADSPGTGTVTFTNEPGKNATGNSDVVVTNLRVSSTAPATSPDVLHTNGAYSFNLALTDSASGASTTMTFTGKLSGTFSSANANVTNAFSGQRIQTWTAPNGNVYTVSLVGYTPPGPPTATNAGSISAHITVQAQGVHIGSNSPEPSTLVLSCLGLTFAGAAAWRKRRRSLASMLA